MFRISNKSRLVNPFATRTYTHSVSQSNPHYPPTGAAKMADFHKKLIRRAAIDIGSGNTKLMIADLELSLHSTPAAAKMPQPRPRIVNEVRTEERVVYFGLSCRENAGDLTAEVQELGLTALREFTAIIAAENSNAPDGTATEEGNAVAVGTEVFRRAQSGPGFLARVRAECGLDVRLISQEKEAELGYLTGVAAFGSQHAGAAAEIPADDLIVYDSGGGSFQFTRKAAAARGAVTGPLGQETGCAEPIPFDTFLGAYASAHVFADLMAIKRKNGQRTDGIPIQQQSPSPVLRSENWRYNKIQIEMCSKQEVLAPH